MNKPRIKILVKHLHFIKRKHRPCWINTSRLSKDIFNNLMYIKYE